MISPQMLIRTGNFFCQECMADFDTPAGGIACPICGGERISEDPDETVLDATHDRGWTMNHEDQHVFAVWSPNMATAVEAINMTKTGHLLRQIVTENREPDGGYWLIYKDDSWARQQWKNAFRDALILPRRS